MDWKRTIGKNRRALAGVIAGLIAMAGHGDPLPPSLRRAIVRILRATEDGPPQSRCRILHALPAGTRHPPSG